MLGVEVARLPEQAELITALAACGFPARPLGDLGIEVACEDCGALLRELESWIGERDLPLVPIKVGSRIFLQPPSG